MQQGTLLECGVDEVVLVEALPRSSVGKLLRHELAALARRGALD